MQLLLCSQQQYILIDVMESNSCQYNGDHGSHDAHEFSDLQLTARYISLVIVQYASHEDHMIVLCNNW